MVYYWQSSRSLLSAVLVRRVTVFHAICSEQVHTHTSLFMLCSSVLFNQLITQKTWSLILMMALMPDRQDID